MAADRKQIVRDSYAAFAAGDRSFFEERLSDDKIARTEVYFGWNLE